MKCTLSVCACVRGILLEMYQIRQLQKENGSNPYDIHKEGYTDKIVKSKTSSKGEIKRIYMLVNTPFNGKGDHNLREINKKKTFLTMLK